LQATKDERVPVLQINQQPGDASNHYRISVRATEIPDRASLSFDADIEFALKPAEAEGIRWYLEDYLQFDEEPAPQIAKHVEASMVAHGEKLFREIFKASSDATRLWDNLEPYLSSTRIEIDTGIAAATAIPWELIRNPDSATNLALSAAAFVRSQRAGQTVLPPEAEAAKVRILLIISRPGGGADVPFRSVANRLVTELDKKAHGAFELHVLRPPTYEQLVRTLDDAKKREVPFHIVHFDGHGVYGGADASAAPVISDLPTRGEVSVQHGYLAFESPASSQNAELVDGFKLGALLNAAGVPVLVLNACQSAYAEASSKPVSDSPGNAREEVEAYGSLAQAVMGKGAAGVVAMRYSVLVTTAAQFMAELYGALARGRRLGEAVTWARKNLHARSDRQLAYEPRPLQDWSVPVVWERAPLRLWPEKPEGAPLKISLGDSSASSGVLDPKLPARPDFGFFGRDETLYAMDRAFDDQRIVLLHAYAGSGKTSTAREFAVWYQLTGGVRGPVLFNSFERHLPLARVLDKIGEVFGGALEAARIQWDAITDLLQRRAIALQVLEQIPVLWIWDNVEPVTGFPMGTASEWSGAEQEELRGFLTEARETRAKFLLTSRRDETSWLGSLPLRVQVPPMPMQECLQLAGAVAARRGRRLAELPDLRPLLRFTRGNPLTVLVTVGEALRTGIGTEKQLDSFLEVLRSGEVDFADEETEGRSRSLGASLSYGFTAAFTEDERKMLALLHLFQGFVGVIALLLMGRPEANWCLDAVRGLTRERGIALLDRAAEIGLLSKQGYDYYAIHPALPWYFSTLFEESFPERTGGAGQARKAFAEVMGEIANFYANSLGRGEQNFSSMLAAEEDNLIAAWHLARANGWWRLVTSAMQGLRGLYSRTGRQTAWRRLVEDVVPDFVEPMTGAPLENREDEWTFITDYRLDLALADRKWAEAERLQHACVDWDRRRAQPARAVAADKRDAVQVNDIRSLAVSLQRLARIQTLQANPACADNYREALDIGSAIEDSAVQAACAQHLAVVHTNVSELRDLDEAERWCRKSLEMRSPGDQLGRASCLGQLGRIARERFKEAQIAGCSRDELVSHLADSTRYYEQGIDLMPATAAERGVFHNQLGNIYSDVGDIDRARYYYQQDIRYCELAGDVYGAGQTRRNVALLLFKAGSLADARAYAVAALDNFQSFEDRAADLIQRSEGLLAEIDQAIARKAGGS
jgi:tetratricopeptide (TPR) repeat protein